MTTENPNQLLEKTPGQDRNNEFTKLSAKITENVARLQQSGDPEAEQAGDETEQALQELTSPDYTPVLNLPRGPKQSAYTTKATELNQTISTQLRLPGRGEIINSGKTLERVEHAGVAVDLTQQTIQAVKQAASLAEATMFLMHNTTVGSEINMKLRKDPKFSSIKAFKDFDAAVKAATQQALEGIATQLRGRVPEQNAQPEKTEMEDKTPKTERTPLPSQEKQAPAATSAGLKAKETVDTSPTLQHLTEATKAAQSMLNAFQPKTLGDIASKVEEIHGQVRNLVRTLETALPNTGSDQSAFEEQLKILKDLEKTIDVKKDLFNNPIAKDMLGKDLSSLRKHPIAGPQVQRFDRILSDGKATLATLTSLLAQEKQAPQSSPQTPLQQTVETRNAAVTRTAEQEGAQETTSLLEVAGALEAILRKAPQTARDVIDGNIAAYRASAQLIKLLEQKGAQGNAQEMDALARLRNFSNEVKIWDIESTRNVLLGGSEELLDTPVSEILKDNSLDHPLAEPVATYEARAERILGVLSLLKNPGTAPASTPQVTREKLSEGTESAMITKARELVENNLQDSNTLAQVAAIAPQLMDGIDTLIRRIESGSQESAKQELPSLRLLSEYLHEKSSQMDMLKSYGGDMAQKTLGELLSGGELYKALIGPMKERRELGISVLGRLEKIYGSAT